MTTVEAQHHALRHSAAWSEARHVHVVRVTGEHAFEKLDSVCPAELYLQDSQILATLLLDEAGRPVADVLVARDDRDFILLAEGMTADEITAYFADADPELDFAVEDMLGDGTVLSVDGPYAWEVVASVMGPDTVGLPYLSFLSDGDRLCFRAGKTGEFGYLLLVPDADVVKQRLVELADRFDMPEATLEALDQCALENWFFNIRREGRYDVTPLELQLQWRVSYRKEFRGAGALQERRRAGLSRRLTTMLADGEIAAGDPVMLGDRVVGEVANAGYSPTRGEFVAIAFIETELAVPGIDAFAVDRSEGRVHVRTVSPPVLTNRSLFVSPQLHSYATRDEDEFPPLVHARPGG